MLNMLRMDLRRMFRAKMMFIAFLCLSAGILISIITLRTVTDPELRQQAIDAGVEITSDDQTDFNAIRSLTETQALCTTIYSGSFIFVALYIIVVLFVCNDYSSGVGPPSHLPGYAVRDRSSVGRALACRPVSSLLEETAPAFSLPGTGSPGGGCSPAAAAGTTAPPCPGWDCGGACPESASSPPLCADWDDCGADGTGKPMTLVSRSSAPSRSKYTTGFCYISGWPG